MARITTLTCDFQLDPNCAGRRTGIEVDGNASDFQWVDVAIGTEHFDCCKACRERLPARGTAGVKTALERR